MREALVKGGKDSREKRVYYAFWKSCVDLWSGTPADIEGWLSDLLYEQNDATEEGGSPPDA